LRTVCRKCNSKRDAARNNPRRIEGIKVCTKCGESKSVDNFSSCKRNSDGLETKCKSCYGIDYIERKKRVPILPEDGMKTCCRCDLKKKLNDFNLQLNTIDNLRAHCKVCEYKEYRKRLKNDDNYRIALNLGRRMNVAVRSNQQVGSGIRDLGCSIEFFKQYLESLRVGGMTWNMWKGVGT